jgi:hypothetical protein
MPKKGKYLIFARKKGKITNERAILCNSPRRRKTGPKFVQNATCCHATAYEIGVSGG